VNAPPYPPVPPPPPPSSGATPDEHDEPLPGAHAAPLPSTEAEPRDRNARTPPDPLAQTVLARGVCAEPNAQGAFDEREHVNEQVDAHEGRDVSAQARVSGGRAGHGLVSERLSLVPRPSIPFAPRSSLPPATAVSDEEARRARRMVLLEHLFPWLSLAVSIVGVVMMDHSESRGGMIAIAAAVSWVAFLIVALVHRPTPDDAMPPTRVRRAVRFVSTFANQSLIHYSLLFSAPFYLEACAFTPLQCVFAAIFLVAVVVASWDPWCARVLLNPLLGSLLLAFASFVGWNVALPMLGVPHRVSIWASAGIVGLGIPIVNVASGVTGARRAWSLVTGLGLPLLLAVGGVQALPPAPLRVVSAKIGTGVAGREPVGVREHFATSPKHLLCWTAIRAPRGLKDGLLHVWSRDGSTLRAVPVEVRGGRRAGFRTWSRQFVGTEPGRYRCDVITTLGQSLGGTGVTIGP